MKIGRITLSDRASSGVYQDKSGPEIERVIREFFEDEIEFIRLVLPDEREPLRLALIRLCDEEKCHLVITTGGTGPSARDITPEATRDVLAKELPGFGETMRHYSYERVKTSILSRATAGVRGSSMIINLPGRPRAIGVCLTMLREAIAEGLEHISGFRPTLKVKEYEVPIHRFFPFLKKFQAKKKARATSSANPGQNADKNSRVT